MIEEFPRIAVIYASANDTDLLCATGNRTHLDRETKKSTYVWDLKGLQGSAKRNVTFDLEQEEAPDVMIYYLDNDRTQAYTARYPYTDYSTCMIIDISFLGDGHNRCKRGRNDDEGEEDDDDKEEKQGDDCNKEVGGDEAVAEEEEEETDEDGGYEGEKG
ncbi:hypothetical protein HPB50_022159 [Hyalomma asiaticum]|uniref:Uncharacterized protein n=1 Tax=Hyalomma asiaticum TaxID=266040 RepID=A0ACB7RY66_HYAAI|nr:hypothetical protein HPB50_022159 [Hyalomma asiaticum]